MATQAESLVVSLDANVGAYNAKMKTAAAANEEVSKTSSVAGKNVGNFGRQSGMAGIQVQQFVGQIQGGQSAMVALSQQSADLGFVLGAPLLGAVVGITASVIGMAFAFSDADVELEKVSDTVPDLIKKFNELDEAAKRVALGIVASEIATQEKALKDTKKAADEYLTSLNLFTSTEERSAKMDEFNSTILSLGFSLAELKESYKELSPEGGILASVLDGMESQNEALIEQAEIVESIITKNIDTANAYGMTAREIAIYKAELVGANEAQKEAINLSFDIVEAKKAEIDANQKLFDIVTGKTMADPELANSQLLHEQRLADEEIFQELIAEIKFTGMETTEELYFKELAIHQAMLDSKLISEEDFASAQLKLSKQYSKGKDTELKDLKKTNKNKIKDEQSYLSIAGSVSTLLFDDNKNAGRAMAFVNTAVGVTKALSAYDYAGAAAIALAGAAQVAAISSTSKDGGGGSIATPTAPTRDSDFQQETSSLDFSDSSAGGSQATTINFGTDSGDDIIDAIAAALNKAQAEGRA